MSSDQLLTPKIKIEKNNKKKEKNLLQMSSDQPLLTPKNKNE